MKLRFTRRAANDIFEIADYIKAENPVGALRVRAAILESTQLLAQFPQIGRAQSVEGVRKIAEIPSHRPYRQRSFYCPNSDSTPSRWSSRFFQSSQLRLERSARRYCAMVTRVMVTG